MQADLILASTSRYRAELLDRLGVAYRQMAPSVKEIANPGENPQDLALRLAQAKALEVAQRFPDAIVIGSDQVPALDQQILRKPGTRESAIRQLKMLRGREHKLFTAVCCARSVSQQQFSHLDTASLELRADLSDAALQRYVSTDDVLDCAGSYKLESLGISLFSNIVCDDWTAIQGLPLLATCHFLRQLGIHLP